MLPPVAFLAPYCLGFLIVLPALWWLMRLLPPLPRKVSFPAIMLLQGLTAQEETPARTPWWILALRLLAATLVITAFASPVIDPEAALTGKGALLVVVDNDWAAANGWETQKAALDNLIRQAGREDRSVLLLPTAASADGQPPALIGPLSSASAYDEAKRIAPEPWAADRASAAALLKNADHAGVAETIWLASGTGSADAQSLYAALQAMGSVRVLTGKNPLYLLDLATDDAGVPEVTVLRGVTGEPAALSVAAIGKDGDTLAHLPVIFSKDAPRAAAKLDLPLEVRNRIAFFEIEGVHTAASVFLLDSASERRPVGLAGDKGELDSHSLLSGLYYLDRALKPYADLHIGPLAQLLNDNMAVIALTDDAAPMPADIAPLKAWVKKGGVLVRFAGDRLAAGHGEEEDELLPATLRTDARAMGGALSWAAPQKLRPFPATSPFHGLSAPDDVTVSRQILAEPSETLVKNTWAELADGTPLVTAKAYGQGLSVLFHVPASSGWSNLPLSGLFVDMLRRISDLSRGMGRDKTDFAALQPLSLLDGFGVLQKPGAGAKALGSTEGAKTEISPSHPPGLYGSDSFNRALNLGPALAPPLALSGVPTESYAQNRNTGELGPWLLLAAFVLLLADFVISLRLRGLLVFSRAALTLLCLVAIAHPVRADEKQAIDLTSKTILAYVRTGDRATDDISEAGLTTLARVLQRRTSIDAIGVAGVSPDSDDLAFYPLLYWPLEASEPSLSLAGAARVNDYLHHGGMILFDTLSGEPLPVNVMRRIVAGIDLPPLEMAPENHVLKRSFYLLDDFPGRYAAHDFWIENADTASAHDNVASVLMGENGWAAAWASDGHGAFLYPCVPGGELQRELAFRFGVNLVMYALTGNYKSDQLHAEALLKKLGK